MSVSVDDYPEHLNPFDENYGGAEAARTVKYNTWSSARTYRLKTTTTVATQKPTLLQRPWAALNISPKGKLVRRLSVLKTAVERFTPKKKKSLGQNGCEKKTGLPPRSNSLHEDFNFRIISPRVKEKIRQQAFSRSISQQEQCETNSTNEVTTPQSETAPVLSDSPTKVEPCDLTPTTPESEKNVSQLGARPKRPKKKPPPPPPPDMSKLSDSGILSCQDKSDDNNSANSSITQDLEKDISSDEENSLVDICHSTNQHQNQSS